MLGAITLDRSRLSGGVSERHTGVRSKQIQRIAGQSGGPMLRLPVENVRGHLMNGAPGGQPALAVP
jgi:hypothetical protein